MQQAAALDGQGVHRHALGSQAAQPGQGFLKHLQVLPRQPGDQIHIDMAEAHLPRQGVGLLGLAAGVAAADARKRFIVLGLGIDADARHPVVQQRLQLVPVNGIRAAPPPP